MKRVEAKAKDSESDTSLTLIITAPPIHNDPYAVSGIPLAGYSMPFILSFCSIQGLRPIRFTTLLYIVSLAIHMSFPLRLYAEKPLCPA